MATQDGTIVLDVRGMTCASCVRRVERALSKVDGVDIASVNFANETARVSGRSDLPLDALVQAVKKAGYEAEEHHRMDPSERGDRGSRTLKQLVAGAIIGIPAIVLAMAMDIAGLNFVNPTFHGWLVLALATPVQVVLGWRFYKGAYASLRQFNPNMDVLIALGTSIAFIYSTVVVIQGSHEHMYFDVSVAVLLFITLGKYFEERSKGEAGAAIAALLDLAAKNATVLVDGQEREVATSSLKPGDTVVVRPGERVPADGVIAFGHSAFDESMLTGESIPVERGADGNVVGGTINQSGLVHVRVAAVGEESTLNQLVRMVEEAQGSKSPVERVVDQVAAVFVPVVILIAAATYLAWGIFGGDWNTALVAAVAVLIIACPCALGLATPTAIMVGTGMGAQRGILIRNAEVLERVRKLDVVVLDKTGTLTQGRPEVADVVAFGDYSEDQVIAFAASAESGSEHPLARAVVDSADERNVALFEVDAFDSVVSGGVVASVGGHDVVVGNLAFLRERGIGVEESAIAAAVQRMEERGRTVIAVGVDRQLAGLLGLADELKPNAARAVAALKSLGVQVVMLTGDSEAAARTVAEAAGVDTYEGNVKPSDKMTRVQALQANGLTVAMVGDGVNDAPALAQADVGMAMSTGSDAAIASADITLLHGDVGKVAEAVLLSRGTLRTIKQNLSWAFGYNVLAIPVAALALLNPIVAQVERWRSPR